MKNLKRFLSLVLGVVMIASMFSVIATSQAAAVENSNIAQTSAKSPSDFSWDNASVYFLLTDRFYNGNKANDHSYNRLIDQDGSVVTPDRLNSTITTFHGGDFAGITKKINEGYFDDLGVNAIWMSAPYEQIHGYVVVNGNDKKAFMPHYAYHGYYALDYTQTDANFGTAQEFKTMVDTAHKHGIRVVLDIVMNHPGYNTLYDMLTLKYGGFKSYYTEADSWKNHYSWKSGTNYHTTIDYETSAGTKGWAQWWGADWLRAGLPGYTRVGNDPLTGSAGGELPDFKTESNTTVSVPPFIQNKWRAEGRYDAQMSKMNNWFSSNSKSKTVRNYLVCWLSDWVREYGIDGFRCDTAKHVELASWKALSDECTKALKEWRANNKGKVEAANWTDDFWMTAEDYGSGVNKDAYYTSGGFDSKINFSFSGGGGVSNSGSIMNTYNDYANKINSDPNFNVLTYISSHDTQLCRSDLIYQGSAFQLLPGAIQIFYGDESNRPADKCTFNNSKDHNIRSDMNWSSLDKNVLSHWQKVGTFRRNHIAVGAGTNKAITATSGVAFVRQYDKNGIEDTVFACIAANKNASVTLSVGQYVENGTTLKNAYDGKTATVSGGKVTFNSGANGTILVEVPQAPTGPDVTVSHTGGEFRTDTLSITATLNDIAKSGTYKIGNASAVTFTGSKTFTIGADMDFDESVTITFTATDGTTTKERSYTYTKVDPNATPFKFPTDRTTYVLDTAGWGSANCHMWDSKNPTTITTEWSGPAMKPAGEYNGKAVFTIEVDEKYDSVVFSKNGDDKSADLTFKKHAYYDNGIRDWVEVEVVVKPTDKPSEKPTTEVTVKPTTGELPTKMLLGDADLDDVITISDATIIQRILAKLNTASEYQLLLGDVNGNTQLDISDATYIQRYLAKLSVSYPINQPVKGLEETTSQPTVKPTDKPTEKPTEKPTDTVDDSKNIVYADMGKQTDAYAYYWDTYNVPMAFPGVKMKHVSGNIYKIEVPKEFTQIIFSESSSGANQTGDLKIPGNNSIYVRSINDWKPYNGDEDDIIPGGDDFQGEDNVIYIVNDANWDSVFIHLWNTSPLTDWPGQKLEKSGTMLGHDLYTYTVNETIRGFVINAGGDHNKSGDLTMPKKGKIFRTSSKTFVDPNETP